jgi:hypothetical protein
MKSNKFLPLVPGSLRSGFRFLIILSLVPAAAWSNPSTLPYTEAVFKARKLAISLESILKLTQHTSMQDRWITASASTPEAEFTTSASGGALLIDLSHSVLNIRSRTQTWIDPDQRVALQRITARTDSKGTRYKGTRYADIGVEVLRSSVANDQVANWPEAKSSFKAYPDWMGDDAAVTDPAALFQLLTEPALRSPGDALQFPVLSRDNLVLIEVTVMETTRLSADFTHTTAGQSKRVKGKRDVQVLAVDARHLDPGSSEDDMELLGMEGDLTFYVDADLRVPLRLVGHVPKIGRVSLDLKAITTP